MKLHLRSLNIGVILKDRDREILEYLYRQKHENRINYASLMELPNRQGINYLYRKGYIDIKFGKANSINKISLTGKGIDWAKSETAGVSSASIDNDIIALQIRPDLFSHIESYLKNKDYFHAVEESYKFVRIKLKELTGSEKATHAFGYEANSPIDHVKIFGHEPVDEIEADFFKGVRFLHLAIQFLRNEKAHTIATHLDKNLALHYISIASLAYDLISRTEEE